MTNAQVVEAPLDTGGQAKLALTAGIAMLFSVGVFIASQLGAIPAGFGTTVVLIGTGIVLKLAWTISSKVRELRRTRPFRAIDCRMWV